MKSINEIRLAAADLLESPPNAWTQRSYRTLNGDGTYAYCLVGACREAAGYYAAVAAGYDADATSAAHHAADAAARAAARTHYAATVWNDAPGRTREEVIAALRDIAL